MVEMFAGLPAGHPFFEQFSFISSGDLPYFQSLTHGVERHAVTSLSDEDRARLLALPFKLIPARHRLGALQEDTKRRILFARRLFAANLPPDLASRISFFNPGRYIAAASLADNILFGKVAHGTTGASRMVDSLIGEIIEELGLARRIAAAGLDFDVGVGGARLTSAQRQKLALARGLVKAPAVLVLVDATSGLDADSEGRILDYLLDARRGPETLIWSVHQPALALRFDSVVSFADGHAVGNGPPERLQTLQELDGALDDGGEGTTVIRGAGR
jgi:ABC-type transport system involved in cytochrome bd biosynthesis fused ATPase/permease subunit